MRFDLYKGSFSDLDKSKVKQVYGIILNDLGEILLVFQKTGVFLLPGGQIEIGESYIDTLNREVYEEAAVCLDQASIHEAFYQEAYFYKNNEL